MNITGNPVDALFGGAALVTGVEPIPRLNGDGVRVYLGPRWGGVHVHIRTAEDADVVIATWTGTLGHLFATDVDPNALCQCDNGGATCSTCGGTGRVEWCPGQHRSTDKDDQPCPDCHTDPHLCRECGGTTAVCHSARVACCPDCTHGSTS